LAKYAALGNIWPSPVTGNGYHMKKLLWIVLVVVILLAVSCSVLTLGKQPQPFPPGSSSEAALLPGSLEVQRYEETFIDDSRPTSANGDYPGAATRTLEGLVWHPATNAAGPYPLIVYSHGFSSTREGGAYLAEQLASLGYVVVSVNYPLTNMSAPGGPNVRDVMNQPADVSFLIDTLLAQSATPGQALEGMIDKTRIGVTGISLGGMTTTLVAYHPELRDKRIAAALSIAGPTAVFTERFFSNAQIPFMMLAGDIDALVPYRTNAAPVLDKIPGSQLVSVQGASHTAFAGTAGALRWMSNPDAIGCYMVNRNIGDTSDEPWYDLIGTEAQGIDHNAVNELCLMDPLPEAINALRQQMITAVVVSNFFQSVFAPTATQREEADAYLSEVMAAELSEVSYQRTGMR
jgi:predicted dienelactone hydrolase